jgi:tetratricopeptide (TPR) repeat protein
MRGERLAYAAIPLALAVPAMAAGWSGAKLERMSGQRHVSAQVLYLPSGKYLKMVSLGFPELMADAIYIWSIQYYSNYEADDRLKYLEHIYGSVISELDPHYVDPYLIGSLIMSVEAHEYEMALRLLDKGIAANPDEWILSFEAGFLCYHTLHDDARATSYFEKALRAPGAPPVIKRLRAEMYRMMGDKAASLGYWREVYETADEGDEYVRSVAWRHVHDLTIEVDTEALGRAVTAFETKTGSNPPSLDALVAAGLLERVPLDPDGAPYLYDRSAGEVSASSRFELNRRAGE